MSDGMIQIVAGDDQETLLKQITRFVDAPSYDTVDWRPFVVTVQHPTLRGSLSAAMITLDIALLGPEDGSGNRWIIEGRIAHESLGMRDWLLPCQSFRGYYDSKRCEGYLAPKQR